MKKITFIAALLCFVLSASFLHAQGKSPACLPQKRYDNGQLAQVCRYDAAGRLQIMEEYKDGRLKTRGAIEKTDSEGRVLEARMADSLEKKQTLLKYVRNADGLITEMEIRQGKEGETPVLIRRHVYENNPASAGILTKVTRYDGAGKLLGATSIESLDANGSSKSVVMDKDGAVVQTEVWMRDDKQSPEQSINAFSYQWLHNRTEYTVTKTDGKIDGNSYKYEKVVYNAQGYLESCTVRYNDGRTTEIKYEYSCR